MVRKRILLVVGAGLVVMGLAFGTVAGVLAAGTAQFLAGAQPAEGVVTSLDAKRVSTDDLRRERYSYRPVVTFDAEGQEHTFTGRVGSDPPQYEVGEQVDVLYDPRDPSAARLASGFAYWFELIFGLVALVLVTVGGALIVTWSRRATLRRLAGSGERATGIVTKARTNSSVRFNGRARTETTVTWRHPFSGEQTFTEKGWGAEHAVGDEVTVRYDAGRPGRAVVEPLDQRP